MSNKNDTNKENSDNLSHTEDTDEALSNLINADDSKSGKEDYITDNDDNNEETEKLKAEIAGLKDKYLRQIAEFDNFRRRSAKESMELRQTAGKDIIQSLLVVLDDVDRASKQLETSTDPQVIKEGVSLVFNKFRAIMQQKGLKVMDAAHQEFNPDLHEAITEIPAPNEGMIGKVIDTVESGYYLNDKLIRHAKVVVGK